VAFWKVLFPERCLGCGLRDTLLCAGCRSGVRSMAFATCPRCARPERLGAICRGCARSAPLDALVAACTYDGVIRKAVHALKFRQGRYVVPMLGELLAEAIDRRPLVADVIVPVPLSPQRLRARGYNHSELLAGELFRRGAFLRGELLEPGLVRRVRDTPPQFSLGANERRRNMQGAFECGAPDAAAGKRILLLDDVCTTGATLQACADVLRAAGAQRVMALVVARDL
jgi:ComF family protein